MADTTVYQQVTDLMRDKAEFDELRPVIQVLAVGIDRGNTLLTSTRKLMWTAIVTTVTMTVSFVGLIQQLSR